MAKLPEVEEIVQLYQDNIDSLEDHDRVEKLTKLMETDFGTSFLLAPSSSRVEYHNCYPGGLAHHSNQVFDLIQLNTSITSEEMRESALFLALVHDFGKAGDGVVEYYIPNDNEWSVKNHGIKYIINDRCFTMSNSDRTLYLLQSFGLDLSPEEFVALKLVESGPNEIPDFYKFKKPEIAIHLDYANSLAISLSK